MKTKEFIKRVEEFGFDTQITGNTIYILKDDEKTIARVEIIARFTFDSFYLHNKPLNEETMEKLFELVVEYAKTPLDERKEEEKWFYEHRFIKTRGGNPTYLAIRQRPNYKYPILQGSYKDIFEYKVEFTDKEMEETKKQYGIFLDDFVKKEIIEVSE